MIRPKPPFQSTPPRRGRRGRQQAHEADASFNPRPRGGGDPTSAAGTARESPCFNPRPRGGGDHATQFFNLAHGVSIHAPAEGATVAMVLWLILVEFQSTPPRRGRRLTPWSWPFTSWFQSTPPRRGRPRSARQSRCRQVSIHAPAEGATCWLVDIRDRGAFQSTPPRRGRQPLTRRIFDVHPVSIHAPAEGATRTGF